MEMTRAVLALLVVTAACGDITVLVTFDTAGTWYLRATTVNPGAPCTSSGTLVLTPSTSRGLTGTVNLDGCADTSGSSPIVLGEVDDGDVLLAWSACVARGRANRFEMEGDVTCGVPPLTGTWRATR